MNELVVGIVQASYTNQPMENVEKTYSLIKKWYREADIVVLPEYSMTNPLSIKDPLRVYDLSEYITGSKYLSSFNRLVNELGINLLVHFIEKTDRHPLTKSTSVLITTRGEVLPVYHKMHLFDAYGYRESDFFEPGKSPSKIISINGFQIAFAICYDMRFPELFRTYARQGAHVVIVQAGWVKGPFKEELLDKILVTRAHENTLYIVLANQTGDQFTGRSGVFNPMGYRELDLGHVEKYAEHTLLLENVLKTRDIIPVIKQSLSKWDIKTLLA